MASLLSLSDDALLEILERIPLIKRHTVLALVCHRFRRLVNSSARLHATLDLLIGPKQWPYQPQQQPVVRQTQLARLSSLCAWLAQHAAGSVRQLRLAVTGPYPFDAGHMREIATAVEALLLQTSRPAGGITRGLTALALADHAAFSPKSPLTVAALSSLRRLMLLCNRPLEWSLPAGGLPQLQQLSLKGRPLVVAPTAHFPPSLTRLWLAQELIGDGGVPHQVQGLTGLRSLGLCSLVLGSDTMLPAGLRHLALFDVDYNSNTPPRILEHLTALESLLLKRAPEADLLPKMSAMRSLRLVACLESDEDSRLPAGPMLEGLECLVADVDFAARSASVLAAATRLHTLGLVNRYTGFGPEETDDDDEEDGLGVCWRAVWREALRLPPLLPALRHLALGGSSWNLRKFVQDVVDVQRSLPHLDISCLFASEGQEDAAQRRLLARCGLRLPCVQSEFNSFIA